MTTEPGETPHGRIAHQFASCLVARNFDAAHQLLTGEAKAAWPPSALGSEYLAMIEGFDGPPNLVQVMNTLEEWPEKRSGDVGWAYAAIAGEGDSEAVTVVVCDEGGRHLVRSIEWGRP